MSCSFKGLLVEIIKPGIPPEEAWVGKTVECVVKQGGCGAVIKLEKKDKKKIFLDNDGQGSWEKITCPTPGCGRDLLIPW